MCSCIRFNCFWSSQLFKAICSLALSYLLRASISSPPRLAACSHTSLWASSTRKLNSIKASESAKRRTKWNDVKEWVRERRERERNYLKFNYTWKRKHWEMFCYLMKASKRRRWTTALFRFFSSSSPPHYSAVIIHTWKKIDAKLCEGSYKKRDVETQSQVVNHAKVRRAELLELKKMQASKQQQILSVVKVDECK